MILAEELGFNTRACGIDIDHALIPISPALLYWADEVVCMDVRQRHEVEGHIAKFNKKQLMDIDIPIHVLNIADNYAYMDIELQREIRTRYSEVVNE